MPLVQPLANPNRRDQLMQKRRIVVAAAAALTVTLSACGGEKDPSPKAEEAPATSSSSSTASSTSTEESTTSETSTSADVTAPGTELDIGEAATVPFEYAGTKSGTIAITVTSVKKGDKDVLEKYGDKAKGFVPYYVKFEVENISGTDLSRSRPNLRATTADGGGTGVVISGDVPGECENDSAGTDFTTTGATFESCKLQAAPSDTEITGAEFSEGDKYRDEGITWTK